MKFLKLIKKILASTCVFFTVIYTFVYTLGFSMANTEFMKIGILYSILAFSFVLSAMNTYLTSNSLVLGIRIFFHYIVTAASFAVFLIIGNGASLTSNLIIGLVIIYSAIYALFAAIYAIFVCVFKTDKKKKSQKKNEYKKQF